ncbi:hypothetical protein [Ruania zhangjianzhongii]|uniref:hypothetical protein n=1 Tax=Ruania zhangjianzhongii TaxID=2603206 RepID=UPI0011CA6D86|nr:hypothetical protein [Ruania zhangjianzhongii]
MRLNPTTSVHALLCTQEWSDASQHAVAMSLQDQVAQIGSADLLRHLQTDAVLVVSSPVVFAHGAVKRIQHLAAHPNRIVTRVLLPDQDPGGVALWSGAWLRRQGIDLENLPAYGLAFDRAHLSHVDPQARAWVRADEVGVATFNGAGTDVRRWARTEGVRLQVRRSLVAARSLLGRVRRGRTLSRQRRRQGEQAHRQVR